MTTSSSEKRLTKKELRQIFWRSCMLDSSWNYERQQNIGYSYAMTPVVKKLHEDGSEKQRRAYARGLDFMAVTPQLSTLLMGINAAMEEENANNEDFDDSTIVAVKTSLMGPLAGVGDSLIAATLRIIATGVAIGFSQQGSWLGPILFALIYNIPNQIIHWFCGSLGMKLGTGFITEAMASGKMQAFTKGFTVLGMIMVGAMTAQFVTVKTTLVIPTGGATFDLQAMFDSILPGFVPLAVTMGCFFYLRKSKSKNSAMILLGIILACCVVCTLLGITGGAA